MKRTGRMLRRRCRWPNHRRRTVMLGVLIGLLAWIPALADGVLVDSGLTYTIIRNGLLENDDNLSSGQARLTEDQAVLGRITRPDLAAVTMECVATRRCANKILHAVDDNPPASRGPVCAAHQSPPESDDATRLR